MRSTVLISIVVCNGLDIQPKAKTTNRRQLLAGIAASVAGPMVHVEEAEAQSALDMAVQLGALGGTRPYAVEGRRLSALAARDAVGAIANAQTIWLGEHRTDAVDHEMQVGIVAAVAIAKAASGNQPCVGVGLEAVRTEYQSALDDFISGKMPADLRVLAAATKWESHWPFPIENYDSVLGLCRELELPILALGASSPDINTIEHQGLAALDKDAWNRLDLPEGATTFGTFENAQFVSYQVANGVPKVSTMPPETTKIPVAGGTPYSGFANQYCGRLVWDESMAARAASWIESHQDQDPTLLVLAGAEHVTYGCGAPDRCARRLNQLQINNDDLKNRSPACSVLLNPRADDFARALPLEARKDPALPERPLADLVWFSPWSEQFL